MDDSNTNSLVLNINQRSYFSGHDEQTQNTSRKRSISNTFTDKDPPKKLTRFDKPVGHTNYVKSVNHTIIGSSSSNNSSNIRTQSDDNNDKQVEELDANQEKDHRDVTSCLFTGNPDIPTMPEKVVNRIYEKLFSDEGFASLNIAYQIVSNVEKLGCTSMTMVQQLSIPLLLAGKDVLVKSQTGSGKTLTYAIPIIHKLMTITPKVQRNDGTYALIVVPTRELALQSYQWFEKLCKSCVWVVPGYLIGGEKKKAEKARLRKGVNILIATPGRLIDHIHQTKSLQLNKVRFLVIDEADRLMEMGYEQSITSIVQSLTEQKTEETGNRQTMMLSATLTSQVDKLAGLSLCDPEIVDVSITGDETGENATKVVPLDSDSFVTPKNLSHHFLLVPAKLRLVTLAAFVLDKCRFTEERKMLIFMATQDMVDYHTIIFQKMLSSYGNEKKKKSSLTRRAEKVLAGGEDEGSESSDSEEEEDKIDTSEENKEYIHFFKLHGNMSQKDRTSVFHRFQTATAGVLLCTDVASRGLDLPKVSWIVQYNGACTAADYVHRVGRTARVNAIGSALTFLAPAEAEYIQLLQDHKITLKEMMIDKILPALKLPNQQTRGRRTGPNTMEEAATSLQLTIEKLLLSDRCIMDSAKKAYLSYVRSYATYPREVREIFNFKTLHLGHNAKSFGLRDSPSSLGAVTALRAKRDKRQFIEKREKHRQINVMKQKTGYLPKMATMSEFDSGLDSKSHVPKDKTKPYKNPLHYSKTGTYQSKFNNANQSNKKFVKRPFSKMDKT